MQVDIDYFDDVDPATILYSKSFLFERTTVQADMRAIIVSEGQTIRALLQREAQINGVFPVGTTISIP